MQDIQTPRTGFIEHVEQPVNFYLDDYTVTLMGPDFSFVQLENTPFIYGRLHANNHQIAFYKGNVPVSFNGKIKIHLGEYFVAASDAEHTNWETFTYMEFRNGTLFKVFPCRALDFGSILSKDIQVQIRSDKQTYSFPIGDQHCTLEIMSDITGKYSMDKGNVLSNNTIILSLHFDAPQPISSASRYIQKMKDLLSLMTFRKNVGFDEIYLGHDKPPLSRLQLFLKEDLIPYTDKPFHLSLSFWNLDTIIASLASLIFNSRNKKPAYVISFLPASDKEAGRITHDQIRSICSALECELSFFKDFQPQENRELAELTAAVKKLIKDHRKGKHPLPPKTYDLMLSSISHWTMSASDKICRLFHFYEKEMRLMTQRMPQITDEDIAEFVKYRNNITHGYYMVSDQLIVNTAYVLQGLVYCSLLTRAGLSRDKLMTLCQRHQILI